MNSEVYVVLAYDNEEYIIKGITETKDQISEEMLECGMLESKVIKVRMNELIKYDLLDYDAVDMTI